MDYNTCLQMERGCISSGLRTRKVARLCSSKVLGFLQESPTFEKMEQKPRFQQGEFYHNANLGKLEKHSICLLVQNWYKCTC